MVSKARLDFPDPDSPVTTMRLSRGNSSETFLRLCTRAPCTAMVVRADGLALFALLAIGGPRGVEKRQLFHVDVAPLGEANAQGRLADQALVGEILASSGDAFDAEIAAEVVLNLGGGPGFAHFAQVIDHQPEQHFRPFRQVAIDGG